MKDVSELTKNSYRRKYKMRGLGDCKQNTVVSIPRIIVSTRAANAGLTIDEYIKQYRAVAHYNNFDGVLYTFEPKDESGNK